MDGVGSPALAYIVSDVGVKGSLTVPAEEIPETEVVYTIVGGEVAYRRR